MLLLPLNPPYSIQSAKLPDALAQKKGSGGTDLSYLGNLTFTCAGPDSTLFTSLTCNGGWHFLNNSKPACVLPPAEASSSSSQHRSRVFTSKEKIGPSQKRLRHFYKQVARALAPATSLAPNTGVHIASDVGFSPPRLRTLSRISSMRPLRSCRMRSNSRSDISHFWHQYNVWRMTAKRRSVYPRFIRTLNNRFQMYQPNSLVSLFRVLNSPH